MFEHFRDYAAGLKPALDAAFDSQLAQLLGKVIPHRSEGLRCLSGGKKIRGALLCLVTETLGGRQEAAWPRAVAVELIQTASLVHDDFVDQHLTRRNRPAFWTLAGARRAVLLGDIVFSSAIHMMSELSREDCRIVSRAIAELSRGAYHEPLEPDTLLEELDGTSYERIISLKTGILFAAACELGAVAAGAAAPVQRAWRRYGRQIGEAYQIADDIHEVVRALSSRSIGAKELLELIPALLFFVPSSRPVLGQALAGGLAESEGELEEAFLEELLLYCRKAAGLMQRKKQQRLCAAVAELDGIMATEAPANGEWLRLARRTPWDLIEMFDGTVQDDQPSLPQGVL